MSAPARPPQRPEPQEERTLGMLFMTRRCNLDCAYCHMAHEGIPDIPEETLLKGIDLLFSYSPRTMFHFFGGEPLLRMDLIQRAVAYIEDRQPEGYSSTYFITTNGLLLHRHLDWLTEKGFDFMLSVDGSFESQRAFRVAGGNEERAYERIFETIGLLNERGLRYFCNMCVSPENVHQMVENVGYLKGRGVKQVQLGYELGAMWTPELRRAYLQGLRAAIEAHHRHGEFVVQNSPYSEPVLGNPFFVVDVNGDMFQGCAVVLEKTLPTFNDTARLGHISQIHSLDGLQRDRVGQIRHFLRGTRPNPQDYPKLRSNMHLGYQVRWMLTEMGHGV